IKVGGELVARVGVAARDLLELQQLLAGGGREGLGGDVVAGGEVVVEQPDTGAGSARDLPHRRLGEPPSADDLARGVDQLGASAIGPAWSRGARRGLWPRHAAGTCSTAAVVWAAGTAASAASTRRCLGGMCTE